MIENYNELVLDVEVETGTVFEDKDEKVKQIPSATNANYEVLFSETPDNEEHTEFAKKSNHLTYNPSTGNLNVVKINDSTVGNNPKFTDTTYEDATEETHGLMSTTDKIKLNGIEGGAQVNVQSDWAENDDTADDYIKNKPNINDNEITIQLNGTDVDSFTLNQDTNKTVNIVITKDDVGLDQADNTSDLDKPISTATQTALNNKVDIISGKGLSTEDYTTEEKNKLEGISSGAEVNQNAFSNIKIGNSTISADSETDTFELIAGSDITITPDVTNDTVTIASKVYTPASSVVDIDTTGAVGVSEDYARADHTHRISVATGDNAGQVKIAGANATVNGLGTAAFKNVSNTYSSSGTDPVSGQAVAQAIDEIPNPMVFRGSLGVGGTITSLPTDGSANVGDTYKVITDGTYDGQSAQIGDIFICKTKTNDSNTWELIPSGDEPSGTVTSIKLQATTPILVDDDSAITTSGTRTFSHANSGVTADSYGDTTGQTPAFGGTFKVPSATVNATGHITEMAEHTVTIPNATATTETAGLMSSTDKSKLNGIEDNANKTVVDSSLSASSTNPVQNKIVTEALDTKANDEGSYPDFIAGHLSISDDVKGTNTDPYIYRQTPQYPSMGKFAKMHKIVGASIVWNQLGFGTGTSETNQYARLFKQTQGITVVDTIINHKYYISFVQPKGCAIYQQNRGNIGISYKAYNSPTTDTKFHIITSCTESTSEADISAIISKLETTEVAYNLTNCMFVDLTAMFGTTIADYVYTLETSQSGSGIAWLQSYGFFTEDYYAYKQNKLESGCVSAKKIVGKNLFDNTQSKVLVRGTGGGATYVSNSNGSYVVRIIGGKTYTISFKTAHTIFTSTSREYPAVNVPLVDAYASSGGVSVLSKTVSTNANAKYLVINTGDDVYDDMQVEISSTATSYEPYTETTYPISPITLRGLFKLSTDKLTVDGDEYNADGSVTRKYGIVDLGSLNWNYNSTSLQFSVPFAQITQAPKIPSGTSVKANAICSKYITTSRDSASDKNICIASNGNIVVYDSAYTNKDTFKSAMSGEYLIYELAEPTTEQTTPFTETEIVGSTEEFIDYEVAQGNRDVAIPVGTETDYLGPGSHYLDVPPLPSSDGTYFYGNKTESGVYTQDWIELIEGDSIFFTHSSNQVKINVNVDNALDDTSENPVQNKAIYDLLNNLLPEGEATGNPISITNASGFNAKALTVDMLPIQDLHGYDNPWVGGGGKNKLNLSVADIKNLNSGTWSGNTLTTNGIEFTILTENNNVVGIKVKRVSTGTGTTVFRLANNENDKLSALDDLSLILNGCPSNISQAYMQFYLYDGTNNKNDSGSGTSAFTTDLVVSSTIRIVVYADFEGEYTFKPMIRLSTEVDGTFAPYSNICPISGRSSLDVTVNGETETLNFGQTVYGGTCDVVNGGTSDEWGYIASYNGETLSGEWLSDRDEYVSGTTPTIGAEVVYKKTPTTINTPATTIPLVKGNNTLSTSGDNMDLKYSTTISNLTPSLSMGNPLSLSRPNLQTVVEPEEE